MSQRISNNVLIYAKNYIDHHTNYTVESQEYDTWVFYFFHYYCFYFIKPIKYQITINYIASSDN